MLENRFKKFLVSSNTSPERVPASPTSKPLPPEPDLLVQPTRSGPYLTSGFQLVPVDSDDHLPGRTPQLSHSRRAQNRAELRFDPRRLRSLVWTGGGGTPARQRAR